MAYFVIKDLNSKIICITRATTKALAVPFYQAIIWKEAATLEEAISIKEFWEAKDEGNKTK